MAGSSVRVDGVDRLARTLEDAADDLDDLSRVGSSIEASLLPRIEARVPRRSGRLRGSMTATATKTGVDFGSPLVYGRPIHWGWPARHIAPQRFIWDVVVGSTDLVVDKYATEVDRVLGRVKGA